MNYRESPQVAHVHARREGVDDLRPVRIIHLRARRLPDDMRYARLVGRQPEQEERYHLRIACV